MVTELLVDEQIENGRDLIAELVEDGFDVTVAFWARTSEEGLWFLYIGSTSVGVHSLGEAYRRAYACLRRLTNTWIALSEIKLVHATNPIAQEAIVIRDKFPGGRLPTRIGGKRLGNLSIEEAYIYPRASGQMTTSEVLQTVIGLMNRTGAVQPSIVTFSDGSKIQAIPAGINMNSPGTTQIMLLDVVSGTNRTVTPTEIVNIQ